MSSNQQKAAEFQRRTEATATKRNVFQVTNEQTAAGKRKLIAANYPVELGNTDEDDKKYLLQARMVDEHGVVPHMGQAILDSNYFDFIGRKMTAERLAAYQAWVMIQSAPHLGNPAEANWWYSTFPFIKEKKLQMIHEISHLQAKVAEIAARGVQSDEEMQLVYDIQIGNIKVPNVPVHMLPEAEAGTYSTSYQEGMWSVIPRFDTPARPDPYKVIFDSPLQKTQTLDQGALFSTASQGKFYMPASLLGGGDNQLHPF